MTMRIPFVIPAKAGIYVLISQNNKLDPALYTE